MQEQNPSSIHVVENEQAASLVLDKKVNNFLKPFMGAKKSMKEVAEQLGIDVVTLYPHVKRFVDAGLLEVAEEVPRPGRTIKRYQTVAMRFFVPFRFAPLLPMFRKKETIDNEMFLQAFEKAWMEEDEDVWGHFVYKRPDGNLHATVTDAQGQPWDIFSRSPITLSIAMRKLRLSQDKARAMQRELHDVMERYITDQDSSGDIYIARVNLALRPDSETFL